MGYPIHWSPCTSQSMIQGGAPCLTATEIQTENGKEGVSIGTVTRDLQLEQKKAEEICTWLPACQQIKAEILQILGVQAQGRRSLGCPSKDLCFPPPSLALHPPLHAWIHTYVHWAVHTHVSHSRMTTRIWVHWLQTHNKNFSALSRYL